MQRVWQAFLGRVYSSYYHGFVVFIHVHMLFLRMFFYSVTIKFIAVKPRFFKLVPLTRLLGLTGLSKKPFCRH